MRKQQNYQWNTLSLGTCYYPEHWDKNMWEEDLERMLAHGIKTIRIGEFAWSKVEPREGEFTFEFFDEFLKVVAKTDMKVIFGTPTATPPAWLTEKYPEVLNCRMDGVKFRHGMRRHYNYNSPVYQKLCKRIVEKFGEHYEKHPSVIGWQIDNEINCQVDEFYSESDTLAFREFLKEKYGTLDALNQAWGAVFWNQEYTRWEEIYVPRITINNSTNPHQTLDYIRFVSDSAVKFCKMQSDILRKYVKKGDFITTNGMFQNLDNHRLTDEALDVYTYDSYPNFAYCLCEDPKHSKNLNDRRWSDKLTEVRSICPHFGIMEQQSGANGWSLVQTVSVKEFNKEMNHLIVLAAGIVLLVLGISLGFVWYVTSRIAYPAKELMESMKTLAKDNEYPRVKIVSNDEIGMIGLEYNKMAENIETLIEKVYKMELTQKTGRAGIFTNADKSPFLV